MKLKDYLDEMGITIVRFAERLNVSENTIYNIFKGQDIRLSIALKIEDLTKGAVKCKDLAPCEETHEKKQNKSKKNTKN